jgi:hypothetical protein
MAELRQLFRIGLEIEGISAILMVPIAFATQVNLCRHIGEHGVSAWFYTRLLLALVLMMLLYIVSGIAFYKVQRNHQFDPFSQSSDIF